jgi:hypothetical protein
VLFTPRLIYRETESPDGAFRAIARIAPVDSLWPAMPGQGGDKRGWITIYRLADSRNCGSLAVEMASMIADLRWALDANPRAAELVGVGSWNLDDCVPMPGS